MSYTELTVWTRGIIMDKEGRDIVNSVAAAGRLEGKFAQAMENYVDNPDRTNAPTRKYCRVSDGVIENALTYENEHPNIVVLVEETMVKGWDYMLGMPPGGTLVINTHYTPEYMIRFVPGHHLIATDTLQDRVHNRPLRSCLLPAFVCFFLRQLHSFCQTSIKLQFAAGNVDTAPDDPPWFTDTFAGTSSQTKIHRGLAFA